MFLKILLFLSPLLFSSPLLSKLEKPFPRDNFRRIKEISPQQTILKIFKTVFKDPQRAQPGSRAIAALQYGITQGDNLLRQQIAMMMKQENILADPEKNIINLHGFSEMRTILGQLFINPGDIVLYQSNSDLSERELRPFHFLGAKTIGFDFNKYLDRLEGQLKEGKVKIIYLLSDTLEGNPITLENKKLLYAIAKNYNVVIVEDASSRPKVKEKSIPLKSLDEYNRVVYLGELSYLLGEGLRLGYLLAPAEILKQIEIAKQGLTLHPNALTQVIFSEFLKHNLQLNPALFNPVHFSGIVETFSEAEIKALLSSKGKNMWPSEIRRILKFTQKKNIISFAGGIPAPELFPFDALVEILQNLTPQEWEEALKSAPLRGLPRLQNAIGTWLSRRGILTKFENILVTDGSQQGLDLLGRMIGEYGAKAKIITNLPTYLGALTAFMPYLSNGKEQIIHQELEKELASEEGLKKLEDFIQERKIRYGEEIFLYLTPTFGNPDGKIMPLEQRQKILSLAQRWKIKIIEDDPYGEVAWYAGYPGRRIPSLRSLDKEGETVIYLTSNSKVFSPGLRIGYVVGPEHIIARLTQIKEQTVGETDSLSQMLVAKFIENGGMDNHVQNVIIPEYKKRAETMYAVLNRHLRELDSQIEFTQPLGGLFIWVKLPEKIDTEILLQELAEKGIKLNGETVRVAFVPGHPFNLDPTKLRNYLRLNFSMNAPEVIEKGIVALAEAIKEKLR